MPPHDFRLLTLGGLTLQGGEGTPAADALRKQRRKLAVLATLALPREPIARDALTDMFWGEQDEGRARHSLSDALSHLRRVLGPHSITARGTDVELNPGAPLAVDARELGDAVAAERWADALRLYRGPFLDGVHPGDSTRLEAWIGRERRELEVLFLRACEREYAGQRAAARWSEAARVARRWVDADPLSEAAALALLGALEAPETSEADARALQAYEELRARLAKDYGTPPGDRVQARAAVLAERLGASGATLPAVNVEPVLSAGPAALADAMLAEAVDSRGTASVDADGGAGRGTPPRPLRRRGLRLAAATAIPVLAFAVLLAVKRPHLAETGDQRIAVLPFSVRGPAEYAYLREGVVDLLSANLDGAGPFRTVDPQAVLVAARAAPRGGGREQAAGLATQLGAKLFVQGDVVIAGPRVRITAALYERGMIIRRAADATVEGEPDSLFHLVDRLTAQLLAASGSPVPPLGRLAALTTTSLPALKAYLEGESEFREGLYAGAFEAFRRATELDTTFALAHYRVAQAANWAVPPGWSWDSILVRSRLAAANAHRLAPRARLLVDAYAAWVNGEYDDAERGYRAVVRTYPDDVEAWYGLGEVLFHTNSVRGRPSTESGEAFARVLQLEPRNLGALTHLLRVTLRQRRTSPADSLLHRLDSLVALPAAAELHALRAFSHGTRAEQERALTELNAAGNDELLRITAHRVALYAGNLDGAARVLRLLLDYRLAPDVQAHALVWLAQLDVAHGRWRAADATLETAGTLAPALVIEERALLAALPFAPGGSTRAAAARQALQQWDAEATSPTKYPWLAVTNGLHPILRDYLLGVLALRLGDAGGGTRQAALLSARATQASGREAKELARGLAESLRAHAAAAAGRAPEALVRFDAAGLRVSEGLLESQFGSQAYERWARAELLYRAGRLREALPWYATLTETMIDGLIYLGPAEARQAEILERLGNRKAAITHYRQFLELWRDADQELSPWVVRARRQLQALAPQAPERAGAR